MRDRLEDRRGFSLPEISVAVVILTAAVLGLAASTGRMLSPVNEVDDAFLALQAVEARLTAVSLDTRYERLAELYGGVEADVPGLAGALRTTRLTRVRVEQPAGGETDYWNVVVTVSGGTLRSSVSRALVVAAP